MRAWLHDRTAEKEKIKKQESRLKKKKSLAAKESREVVDVVSVCVQSVWVIFFKRIETEFHWLLGFHSEVSKPSYYSYLIIEGTNPLLSSQISLYPALNPLPLALRFAPGALPFRPILSTGDLRPQYIFI